MNQQLQMLCIQTCQCKQFSVDDLINLLQFSEMIAATDRAKRAAPRMLCKC
ncbi:Uncharacterised protein [Shigella sonnei]|nr:Uncharacterised protein [Shigella sonnei]CSQ01441.1 Uncharacterised protein [Shigella sonnei]CSS60916.1 Uncharacterised protein [Shigella sonnei]CST18375.1 Uncharacterised protein [Shigella sonnei]